MVYRSDENRKFFADALLGTRLTDGSFTKYTGLIRGGDFFSTLWCTKILINYSHRLPSMSLTAAPKPTVQPESKEAETAIRA